MNKMQKTKKKAGNVQLQSTVHAESQVYQIFVCNNLSVHFGHYIAFCTRPLHLDENGDAYSFVISSQQHKLKMAGYLV